MNRRYFGSKLSFISDKKKKIKKKKLQINGKRISCTFTRRCLLTRFSAFGNVSEDAEANTCISFPASPFKTACREKKYF